MGNTEQCEGFVTAVKNEIFNAVLRTAHDTGGLIWNISPTSLYEYVSVCFLVRCNSNIKQNHCFRCSSVFESVEKLARSRSEIVDLCLSQSTSGDVFLTLSDAENLMNDSQNCFFYKFSNWCLFSFLPCFYKIFQHSFFLRNVSC